MSTKQKTTIGSSFDDWLREEGILAEVRTAARKRVHAYLSATGATSSAKDKKRRRKIHGTPEELDA